jgi:hypothetical protein
MAGVVPTCSEDILLVCKRDPRIPSRWWAYAGENRFAPLAPQSFPQSSRCSLTVVSKGKSQALGCVFLFRGYGFIEGAGGIIKELRSNFHPRLLHSSRNRCSGMKNEKIEKITAVK